MTRGLMILLATIGAIIMIHEQVALVAVLFVCIIIAAVMGSGE